MKNNFLHIASTKCQGRIVSILLLMGSLFFYNKSVVAQDTKNSAAKLSFTMNLSSIVSNGSRTVKVKLTRKENKKTIIIDDLKSPLNLYLNEVKDHDPATGNGWMSKSYLNMEGEALFDFPAWFTNLADTLHQYTFIVNTEGDPKYEDANEQITISDTKITLDYFGADSIKTASASLSGWKDTSYSPVPNVELKLCIKRTFNFLPIGEAAVSTNENGEVSAEIPLDIPGNANGTITIAARLEDDETYGTVEVTKDVPWVVLPKTNPVRGRTLWSGGDNAPLLLVISSVTIIVIIWGTIFYLIYLLIKIKRLGRTL